MRQIIKNSQISIGLLQMKWPFPSERNIWCKEKNSISSNESVKRIANWDTRVIAASPGLPESVADVTLSVIIHFFTSHARLLFEYECAVRGVITALDHSLDAAAAFFFRRTMREYLVAPPDILMLKGPSTPLRWHDFSRAVNCRQLAYVRREWFIVIWNTSNYNYLLLF